MCKNLLPAATFEFGGLELLSAIGRSCSWSPIVDSPSRLYALLKYCDVIDDFTRSFALSGQIVFTDSHKKAVLADEFGCGFSYLFAEKHVGVTWLLDFFNAEQLGMVSLSSRRARRPDFIGVLPSSPLRLAMIEAKGTVGNHSYCRNRQIPSGCQQLQGVSIAGPGWQIALRVAVGISLRRHGFGHTKLFAGDPEQKKVRVKCTFEEPPSEAIVRCHYLRVARLLGDGQMLSVLEGENIRSTSKQSEPFILKVSGNRYFGTEVIVESQNSKSRVFLGLSEASRESIISRSALKPGGLVYGQSVIDSQEGSVFLSQDGVLLLTELSGSHSGISFN